MAHIPLQQRDWDHHCPSLLTVDRDCVLALARANQLLQGELPVAMPLSEAEDLPQVLIIIGDCDAIRVGLWAHLYAKLLQIVSSFDACSLNAAAWLLSVQELPA